MKAILMSIRPEWVAKILNGEKTIEIRKKFPKDYVGWVYIYCTKGNKNECLIPDLQPDKVYHPLTEKLHRGVYSIVEENAIWNDCKKYILNGKVVARFWCNKVEEILARKNTKWYHLADTVPMCDGDIYHICQKSCLSQDELHNYLKSKRGRAIHITNPKPFDKPKEISEFHWYRKQWVDCGTDCPPYVDEVKYTLTRAPQSWCYMEI